MDPQTLQTIGIIAGLIFSVALHESAHAWTAYRLGDPTGKLLGRITLNPIPHIDLFGTILLPIGLYLVSKGGFTFGYAKPVPYDPRYLRKPVLGSALISAAGPLSNLLFSAVLVAAFVLLSRNPDVVDTVGFRVLIALGWVNVSLAIFNLLPIPPLDGSGVLALFLPDGARAAYLRLGSLGFVFVMLLLQVPSVGRAIYEVKESVFEAMIRLAERALG